MPKTRVQIARADEFLGHWQGAYVLTPEDLQRMAANFTMEVVVDYEHATHNPDATMAPAAGWVQALVVDGDGLYGDVEWTERAAQMIDAGEYRYLSPVFDFYAVDPNSGNPIGPKLLSVALTNVPFIEGMEPLQNSTGLSALPAVSRAVVLNQRFGVKNGKKLGDLLKRLRDEKGLTNEDLAKGAGRAVGTIQQILSGAIDRPPDEVLEGLADALDVSVDRLKEALPKTNTNQIEDIVMNDEKGFRAFTSRLASIFGSADTDELSMLDEARQLRQNAQRLADVEAENERLREQLAAAEQERTQLESEVETMRAAEDEAVLNRAVSEFKIPAADRDAWAERLRQNREATRALLNSIPKGTVNPSHKMGPPTDSDETPKGRARVMANTKVAA